VRSRHVRLCQNAMFVRMNGFDADIVIFLEDF
jgi:hypothetical protein